MSLAPIPDENAFNSKSLKLKTSGQQIGNKYAIAMVCIAQRAGASVSVDGNK